MEYELRRAAGGLEAVPLARPTGPAPWGPRISYICSAGMNPAGIKVLASRRAKTLGEERRRSPDQRPPGGAEKRAPSIRTALFRKPGEKTQRLLN